VHCLFHLLAVGQEKRLDATLFLHIELQELLLFTLLKPHDYMLHLMWKRSYL
jgi:hypothetical protein